MKAYFQKLYCEGMDSFLEELKIRLQTEKKTFVVTANPETLMIGQENQAFDKVLKDEEVIIVPDGIGVVKAAELLGCNMNGRVTGVEISQFLLKQADEQRKSIYLFGAAQEVIETLISKIKNEYPGIVIAGYQNGYAQDKDAVFEKIVKAEPDIVLVALGIPQQELLIHKYYNQFKKGIFVGVGGSFDVLSGKKKRAPQIFIKLNLEWLYRIAKEPKRIKRFYRSNVKFLSIINKMRRE